MVDLLVARGAQLRAGVVAQSAAAVQTVLVADCLMAVRFGEGLPYATAVQTVLEAATALPDLRNAARAASAELAPRTGAQQVAAVSPDADRVHSHPASRRALATRAFPAGRG